MRTCPSCGYENGDDARFCSQCATTLDRAGTPREERKVVTCLFCDLVGFTARAEGMDPEDVRRLLQPYHARVRAELERFGGTVEKFIGDAVVAVFGAPIAHEDDPERAVRAALTIQEALAEEGDLEIRIGITTGEALIALDARPEKGEGMASGDVVNTASRLQAAAPTGTTLVDDATCRATERTIEFEDVDAIEARGKSTPIRAWKAIRARARVGVERVGGAELVGRERELALLRETFGRVAGERSTQLLTLVGVPGIGKSRLVFELFTKIQTGEFGLVYWRHGRSLPYGDGITFWALGEVVKAQAGILESDGTVQAVEKLHKAVRSAVPDEAEARWVERHARMLAGLESEPVARDAQRDEAFAAWRRFLEGLAEERPFVVVFEDLHWADDAMLDFVDYLVEWAGDVPLLVLCTARPELLTRRPEWGGGKVNSATIMLSPLDEEETATLVHALLGRAVIDAELQRRLLEHAGGNPLYAEEFTRMLNERPGSSLVPETVHGLIAARLDTLDREDKELLSDAAVVGKSFWLGALGHERWRLEERLHRLERAEFVRRERRSSVAGESEFSFRHALMRDVAYEQIPRAQRADKHLRTADWIESLGRPDDHAELLAFHYSSALDLAGAVGLETTEISVRALAAVRRAADRARALHAFAAAARSYRRALELVSNDDPERPRLLLELGRSLYLSEATGESELLAARDALLRADDKEGLAEAEVLLVEFYRAAGRPERYRAHMEAVGELADELSPSAIRARALLVVAMGAANRSDYEKALDIGGEALELTEQLGLDELRARCLNAIGWSRLELGDDTGLGLLEQSLELSRALGSPEAIRSCTNLGHQLRHRGEFRRSVELVEEAVRLADRFGDAPGRRWQLALLGQHRYRQGRWDEAIETVESYLANAQSHLQLWLALGTRGLIRLSRGDERGLEDSAASIAAARQSVEPSVLPAALEMRARSLVLAGAHEEAAQALDEALGMLETGIVRAGFDLPFLCVTSVELGRDGQRVLAIARPSTWAEAARHYFAADFRKAADVYAEIGSSADEAEARLRSGRSLLDAGRRSEGEAELRKALAFYRPVGAHHFVRQAEALLDAASEVSA